VVAVLHEYLSTEAKISQFVAIKTETISRLRALFLPHATSPKRTKDRRFFRWFVSLPVPLHSPDLSN